MGMKKPSAFFTGLWPPDCESSPTAFDVSELILQLRDDADS